MTYLLFAAIGFSMAMIVSLRQGDPKRRRAAGVRGDGHGHTTRRLLAVATLLPGLCLAASGDTAAFLVWLGSCAVGGWLATQWNSEARRPSRDRSGG